MSNYVQSTNFATKDALPSGDPLKIVKGTEINTEFNNISVAIATKADLVSPTFTGTPAAPTASAGTSSTQIATTAFVQVAAAAVIPSGTAMLFVQTAAPTGFTKSTTHDNKALRIVSGTASSGGSTGFTSALGTPSVSGTVGGTVGNHTLTTSEIPSHSHTATEGDSTVGGFQGDFFATFTISTGVNRNTNNTGGGAAHNHSFTGSLSSATAAINVQYVDVIIATKD